MLGACFSISGIIFVTIFMITFFSKSNIKTKETRLYGILLLITFFGTFIDIFSFILFKLEFDVNSFLYKFFAKGMLVYFIAWIFIFTEYIYEISNKSILRFNIKLYKIVFALSSILVILIPIKFKKTPSAIYPSGIGVNVTYFLVGLLLLVSLILSFENIKEKNKKKYIPIFLVITMLASATLVQKFFPDSFLINFSLAIVVSVMYFTIENPDIKTIEEIHRAKEISDNANEEKTMFLYNMTSNIRSIAKDINTSADNILDETDNKKVNMEVINDSARDIKGNAAKFTTMTNEILDISQMDSNIKIYNDKYNVKIIIKELVQIYKKKAEDKGISFRTNIASDIPPYLYGDSMGLKKALSIILDNSVKYTSSGFIDFDVSTIIKRDIARLVITVEDSGSGIKAEDLNKIFNKKVNDNERLNIKYNLYNAKRLVILMGGTIIPSSVYGRGTTIKVVLDQKIADMDDALDKYESVYDKKSILLVDDNVSSGKIFTKMLKDTNIELSIVTSGKECLDKIRNKDKYDLILLDEDMEPLDGITVMRKLKEIRTFNTKTILLTKNNDYEYNDDYLEYGFDGYLLKPIDKDKLFELIDKYLK